MAIKLGGLFDWCAHFNSHPSPFVPLPFLIVSHHDCPTQFAKRAILNKPTAPKILGPPLKTNLGGVH